MLRSYDLAGTVLPRGVHDPDSGPGRRHPAACTRIPTPLDTDCLFEGLARK